MSIATMPHGGGLPPDERRHFVARGMTKINARGIKMASDDTMKSQALEGTETTATVVHAIVRTQYGAEVYDWDPSTVFLELRDDFRVEPSSEVMDRWSAVQIMMTTDGFFKRLDAFMAVCNTFTTGQPFFHVFDPVTVEESAWGVTEVALNRELLPFSYPIKKYLRQLLTADGYSSDDFPPALVEVFDARPTSDDIREGLDEAQASAHNRNNVERFIDEQMKSMVHQFNEIPTLSDMDDMILRRGLEEFMAK